MVREPSADTEAEETILSPAVRRAGQPTPTTRQAHTTTTAFQTKYYGKKEEFCCSPPHCTFANIGHCQFWVNCSELHLFCTRNNLWRKYKKLCGCTLSLNNRLKKLPRDLNVLHNDPAAQQDRWVKKSRFDPGTAGSGVWCATKWPPRLHWY